MSLVRFNRCAHCGQVLSWHYAWQSASRGRRLRSTNCCSVKIDRMGRWHVTPLPDFPGGEKDASDSHDDSLALSVQQRTRRGRNKNSARRKM